MDKIDIIEQLKKNQVGPVRLLDEVSKALPPGVKETRSERPNCSGSSVANAPVLGGIGGIVIGRAVAWAIGAGVQGFARSRGIDRAIELFSFPGWLVAGALAFAVVASLLGGVYPASRAAKLDPIRALRGG